MAATILAIDQGTTGSTCLVVELDDRTGTRIVSRGYAEVPQHFPKPGWVEHDLGEIWSSVQIAAREALDRAGIDGKKLAAIGITNQRETSGLWDRHGKPVHRALVWQDRRTTDTCRALAAAGHEPLFRSRTGLVLDPYFSGTKLAWLLANVDGLAARARNGELRFGTIDTWLVHKLTGGEQHVTDVTNASRTLLFDIHRRAWDDELAERLGGIPRALLPEVRSSSEVYGHTRGAGVIPDGIPIAGIAGDQQAALFGQACFEPGMAKCTYGTGAFALVNTGAQAVPSERGLITTIAWQVGGQVTYALEGSVFIAGAAVQWLRDGLGIIQSSSEIEALAASVPDTGGVTFVPALTGLGAPHWNPDARGVLLGLTRGTGRGHIARATLEGIALQVADLLGAMQADAGRGLEVVRVDGGAAANALLMQFQADVLGVALDRPSVLDTTALGAAYLAALGAGCMASTQQIVSSWKLERRFVPGMARAAVDEKRRAWTAAVAKA